MIPLYLHIGLPKTATTTIQNYLADNQAALAGSGWLYPDAGRQYAAHHLLGNLFRAKPLHWVGPADGAAILSQLRSEIDRVRPKAVIMSTESLYVSDPQKFASYFQGFDLRVVCFLRRQDEWLESALRENLKNGAGAPMSLPRYAAAHDSTFDYAARLASWAKVLGDDKVLVHAFETGAEKLPVEQIFLRLIGAEVPPGLHPAAVQNERLNRAAVAYLSQFQARPRVGPKYHRIKSLLSDWSQAHPDRPEWRNFYPPAFRRALVQRWEAGNAEVARRFLAGSGNVLFHKPLPALDEPWEKFPGLDVKTAVAIGEYLADHLLADPGA